MISPVLANIYLHYVLDEWFAAEVQPRLAGPSFLIRYADDFIIGFVHERDARRVMAVLPKRFAKYRLTVHPTKTKLVKFRRPAHRGRRGDAKPGSFDFLGFTHLWRRSRFDKWVLYRKTASDRFTRAITKVAQWCRKNRHLPIREQHLKLCRKMSGHYAYYGITGNLPALARFFYEVRRRWFNWLRRRGGKHRRTWDWFANLVDNHIPLPRPRIVHSKYSVAKS